MSFQLCAEHFWEFMDCEPVPRTADEIQYVQTLRPEDCDLCQAVMEES